MREVYPSSPDQFRAWCPSCHQEQLLIISTEWAAGHTWLADYFECQWCGEEFVARMNGAFLGLEKL